MAIERVPDQVSISCDDGVVQLWGYREYVEGNGTVLWEENSIELLTASRPLHPGPWKPVWACFGKPTGVNSWLGITVTRTRQLENSAIGLGRQPCPNPESVSLTE